MAWRDRTNRVYGIRLKDEDVLTLLGDWRHHDCIALPILDKAKDLTTGKEIDIPRDYRIESLSYSHFEGPHCFRVVISHPSFPEVPDGDLVPMLSLMHVVVRCLPFKQTSEDEPITVEAKGIDRA